MDGMERVHMYTPPAVHVSFSHLSAGVWEILLSALLFCYLCRYQSFFFAAQIIFSLLSLPPGLDHVRLKVHMYDRMGCIRYGRD